MGREGFSTVRVLVCALLIAVHGAQVKMVEAFELFNTEIADVENLLNAKQYADADSKALLLLEQALQQQQMSADTFSALGLLLQNASRFEVSKAIFNAALERYTTDGELNKMASTLLQLATSERHLSNYSIALTYVRRAMSIAQIERNELLKAKLNLELGIIQQEQGEIETALEPLKQALRYFRENNMASEMSVTLLRIGEIYSLLNQATLAHTYYQDAFDSIEETQETRLLGVIKTRIGALSLKTGSVDQAIRAINEGLELLLSTSDVGAIAEAKMLLGRALVENGDTAKGRELLQEAMQFADSSGQAKLVKEGREGETWVTKTTDELFSGKNVVVFSLPGAFTPTCSSTHLPRYNALAKKFAKHGIDEIVCVSVNDTFVMNAWAADQEAANITVIPDGNGEFTDGMGMLVDKADLGFGKRSWRYSMLVKDGVVDKMFIEPDVAGDPFEVSDADTMLAYIAPEEQTNAPVSIITKPGCPFCAKAKKLLDEKGYEYEEIVLGKDASLTSLTAISGRETVPQVFIGGKHIGGSDDLEVYFS